tara:strand:+ start:2233 stop:4536 length:2304 start_codon:yes stop_codon:yes gene_type:complete
MSEITTIERYSKVYCKKLSNLTYEQLLQVYAYKNAEADESSVRVQLNAIRKLAREAIKNNYTRTINYKYSKKNPTSGRLYADKVSLQNIKRQFRGLISGDKAVDLDVKNCHPTLLLYLCKKHNIKCPVLKRYIDERDERFEDLWDTDDILKGDAKILFIKSMNSEYAVKTHKPENRKLKIKNTFFLSFDKEIKGIQKIFGEKYSIELAVIKGRDRDNHYGKLMSRIINIEEGKMLELAESKLSEEQSIMTLCFDGLMIDKFNQKKGQHVDEYTCIQTTQNATKEWGLEWTIKEPDFTLREWAEELKDESGRGEFYASNEVDLVKEIHRNIYDNRLYYSNGSLHLLVDRLWNTDTKFIHKHVFSSVVNSYGYIEHPLTGDVKCVTKNLTTAKAITNAIIEIAEKKENLMQEVNERSNGKISFNNGYWDFKKNKFIDYDEYDRYDTIYKIDRDFEYFDKDSEERKKVYDELLNKMFGENKDEKEALNSMLYEFARCMKGEMCDKIWFMLDGMRNSSKGVLDLTLRNAFGGYVGSFNTSSFELVSKGTPDPELHQKFLLDNIYRRLATSQEISDRWIDGDLIKRVASGGDELNARGLYEKTLKFRNGCKYMFSGNTRARIKPVDALSTSWGYTTRSVFVGEGEPRPPLTGITYYEGDPEFKNKFCGNDDVLNAFCSILFDAYHTPCKFPTSLKVQDDANLCPYTELDRLFIKEKDERITNDDLKMIYQQNSDSFDSLNHMKKCLRLSMLATDYKSGCVRGLEGVCIKPNL